MNQKKKFNSIITYFLHCDLIVHVIFLAVEITASHMKPTSPQLIAVSGSDKGGNEEENVKEGKQIVKIETGEEETNDEENEEEVKQKESQKERPGSKGIPVVPVSTDECKHECKHECIYGLHTVML